jgi:hypothetical protein
VATFSTVTTLLQEKINQKTVDNLVAWLYNYTMKLIYIATAMTQNGDSIQENAYTNAEQALVQATLMCEDINRNTDLNAQPDVVPMELFEDGDVVSDTISTDE